MRIFNKILKASVLLLIALVSIIVIKLSMSKPSSIGIIGGSDAPTKVYVGTININNVLLCITAVIAIIAIIIVKIHKEKFKR